MKSFKKELHGDFLGGSCHIFDTESGSIVVEIAYHDEKGYEAGVSALEEIDLSLAKVAYNWSGVHIPPGVIRLEFDMEG